MITVRMDEYDVIDLLVNRVKYWTDDDDTIELFEQYYTKEVANGGYSDFDVKVIVDNDYINYFEVNTIDEIKEQFSDFTEDNIKARIDDLVLYYAC